MKGEILIVILSASSTVLVSIVGFFLKDLISQFKQLRVDVYAINTNVNNINKDLGYNAARIDNVVKELDDIDEELTELSEKYVALKTEHDLRHCKQV